MSGKKDIDETHPDARLNAGCLLAPTLSFVTLVLLCTLVLARSSGFTANEAGFAIGFLYVEIVVPVVGFFAVVMLRSKAWSRRHKAAAKSLLYGFALLLGLLAILYFAF